MQHVTIEYTEILGIYVTVGNEVHTVVLDEAHIPIYREGRNHIVMMI